MPKKLQNKVEVGISLPPPSYVQQNNKTHKCCWCFLPEINSCVRSLDASCRRLARAAAAAATTAAAATATAAASTRQAGCGVTLKWRSPKVALTYGVSGGRQRERMKLLLHTHARARARTHAGTHTHRHRETKVLHAYVLVRTLPYIHAHNGGGGEEKEEEEEETKNVAKYKIRIGFLVMHQAD